MEIYITPQIILEVIPAKAALPSVLSTQAAVEVGEAEHAPPVEPHTQFPLLQTLELVSEQPALSGH